MSDTDFQPTSSALTSQSHILEGEITEYRHVNGYAFVKPFEKQPPYAQSLATNLLATLGNEKKIFVPESQLGPFQGRLGEGRTVAFKVLASAPNIENYQTTQFYLLDNHPFVATYKRFRHDREFGFIRGSLFQTEDIHFHMNTLRNAGYTIEDLIPDMRIGVAAAIMKPDGKIAVLRFVPKGEPIHPQDRPTTAQNDGAFTQAQTETTASSSPHEKRRGTIIEGPFNVTVKWYDSAKKYGFFVCPDLAKDIYVNENILLRSTISPTQMVGGTSFVLQSVIKFDNGDHKVYSFASNATPQTPVPKAETPATIEGLEHK